MTNLMRIQCCICKDRFNLILVSNLEFVTCPYCNGKLYVHWNERGVYTDPYTGNGPVPSVNEINTRLLTEEAKLSGKIPGEIPAATDIAETAMWVKQELAINLPLSVKYAEIGDAWKQSTLSDELGKESRRMQASFKFAIAEGFHDFSRGYNSDDLRARFVELFEKVDWEGITVDSLKTEIDADHFRRAKILVKNVYGVPGDEDYPGYALKHELSQAISEIGILLGKFLKKSEEV
jgi:hypothetical protein